MMLGLISCLTFLSNFPKKDIERIINNMDTVAEFNSAMITIIRWNLTYEDCEQKNKLYGNFLWENIFD